MAGCGRRWRRCRHRLAGCRRRGRRGRCRCGRRCCRWRRCGRRSGGIAGGIRCRNGVVEGKVLIVEAAAVDVVHQTDGGSSVSGGAHRDGLRRVPVASRKCQAVGGSGNLGVATGNGNRYRAGGLAHQPDGVGGGTALVDGLGIGVDELHAIVAPYQPGAAVAHRYGNLGRYIIIAAAPGGVGQPE